MSRLLIVAVAVTAAAAIAGTGDAQSKRKPSAKGSIKGTVVFDGTPPERGKVNRGADPFCKNNKTPDSAVVVGTDGGLLDVFVQVKGERASSARAPSDPVVINQVGCEYSPRVVGVVSGQELQINNGDATIHNVHAYLEGNSLWNLAQPKNAKPIEKTVDETGLIQLKCDVHPWMRAWAVYVEHTQFDVTDASGSFEITNVPVGKHTLSAWHPTLGTKTVEVTVKKRKSTAAEIHFGQK